tara:strand:- start:4077 stop:5909 length:1833 start_codon:yes stop_codon:yes gene_type:complete
MFNATNQNQQFVPNRTVRVMPDAQTDYGPAVNNQIKIHIPSYIGFLDPKNTKLNMDITMSGRGSLHPDGAAGMWSLCRDLRVQSGDGRAQLEDIQDLNVLTAQAWSFDENDSLNAKRELLEGSSKNGMLDAQLYWEKKVSPFSQVVTEATRPIQVQTSGVVPMSGILGAQSDNVFPLAATSGLRLQLNLETLTRSCTLATTGCTGVAPPNVVGAVPSTNGSATGTLLPGVFACLLFGDKAATKDDPAIDADGTGVGTGTVLIARKTDRDASIGGGNAGVADFSTIDSGNTCAFEIGDPIYICQGDGKECICLGIVKELTKVNAASGGTSATVDRVKITYTINRAGGQTVSHANGTSAATTPIGYEGLSATTLTAGGAVVFFDPRDRLTQITTLQGQVLAPNSYTVQNVSMSVLEVTPPEGYVNAMMDQVNGQGLNMDYCTSRLYRANISSPIGLQSINIPANAERAYSLLSVPLLQDRVNSTTTSSLLGTYDETAMNSYQWVFDGNTVPDRPVDLLKYKHNKNAILHISELEKAVENAKIPVRNLWNIQQRFMIARALSRYGQVHDLSGTSSQLRIDYSTEGNGESTMIETFCVALNRLVVTSMGIEVIH